MKGVDGNILKTREPSREACFSRLFGRNLPIIRERKIPKTNCQQQSWSASFSFCISWGKLSFVFRTEALSYKERLA